MTPSALKARLARIEADFAQHPHLEIPSWFLHAVSAIEPGPGDRGLLLGPVGLGRLAAFCELVGSIQLQLADPAQAHASQQQLQDLPYRNLRLEIGRIESGDYRRAPFDFLYCEHALPFVPPSWLDQLAIGGRLFCPVGGEESATALLYQAEEAGTHHAESLFQRRFPLLSRPKNEFL